MKRGTLGAHETKVFPSIKIQSFSQLEPVRSTKYNLYGLFHFYGLFLMLSEY